MDAPPQSPEQPQRPQQTQHPGPLFAGVEGVWNADPVTVATLLFRQAFWNVAGQALPDRGVHRLTEDLGALCGVTVPAIRFSGGQPESTLLQLALEAVLLWERAGVAARVSTGTDRSSHNVLMLRRGHTVLQSPDPEGALRHLLANPPF
ncbi:hypothetical protein ET445_01385 [Agromyces protaetiae]|uniref:Uncharacterized protein n=1 Tax=Agromyces protaetiae TaxID=2509455 RepID=A0A4V0YGS1_9MICO|nr:hypothetical protein [Agromyces protaetiae]QAY72191.1 hypothetical protein ET445_01385 [Agromyces protaetiae]